MSRHFLHAALWITIGATLPAQGEKPPQPLDKKTVEAAVDAWVKSDLRDQDLRDKAVKAVLDHGATSLESLGRRLSSAATIPEDAPRAQRDIVVALDSLVAGIGFEFLKRQVETGMVFAGQFEPLRPLMPYIGKFYLQLLLETPDWFRVENRYLVLSPLRDLYPESPGPEIVQRIHAIAIDELGENYLLRLVISYALAQWGDRSIVDARIKKLESQIEVSKGEDWRLAQRELADIHYALREYQDASRRWQEFLRGVERDKALLLPNDYYNAACNLSLAGDVDGALSELTRGLEVQKEGRADSSTFIEAKLMVKDPDLKAVRALPQFKQLYEKHFDAWPSDKPDQKVPPNERAGDKVIK